MSGILSQVVALSLLTRGFRYLTRWLGPRRSGLIVGLPSTTALMLVSLGIEQGNDEAARAAEACLAGIVAAAVVPWLYGRALLSGWGAMPATAASVGGYLVVAFALWSLPEIDAGAKIVLAGIGLAVVCHLAGRLRLKRRSWVRIQPSVAPEPSIGRMRTAGQWALPIAYVSLIRGIRAAAGTRCAERFISFPGGSLMLLVMTHMETGPATTLRLAAAMPSGGVGMLAFLAAFRFTSPHVAVGWATALGYLTAISALFAIEGFHQAAWTGTLSTRFRSAEGIGARGVRLGLASRHRLDMRHFEPGVELLVG